MATIVSRTGEPLDRLVQLRVADLPISRHLFLALKSRGIGQLSELLQARRLGQLKGLPAGQRQQLEIALQPYLELWRRSLGRGTNRLGSADAAAESGGSGPSSESILGRELTEAEEELLRRLPVAELTLPVRAKGLVVTFGWNTALDLAAAPLQAVRRQRNCGVRTIIGLQRAVLGAIERLEEVEASAGNADIPAQPEAVRRFVGEIIESLPERRGFVLRERFGLWHGTRETLEDIGYALGVTRERVRQIENRALVELRQSKWKRRSLDVLKRLREDLLAGAFSPNRWGILTEEEVDAVFDSERHSSSEEPQKLQAIALGFLSKVFWSDSDGDDDWFVKTAEGRVFASDEIAERYRNTEARVRSLLIARGRPLPLTEAVKELGRYEIKVTTEELERFCEVSNSIGLDWTDSVGLRRWRFFDGRNVASIAQKALMEFGKPTHFRYITERVNALAPDGRMWDEHAVTVAMLRYKETFVSLGRGMYALLNWGIARPPFIRDFLATAIQELGGKAHGDSLALIGARRYGFKKTSIVMTLSMNPQLFTDLGAGWYAVR